MADKAVFLDRDRTLMEDPGYASQVEDVKLLPGVELALKSLAQVGYKLVVVTNQSGVARGLLSEESLGRIHEELQRQLGEKGAHLDAIYYCPFHPEGVVEGYARESDERKPHPGMLRRAAREMNLDLPASWMIGDSPRDVEAGQRADCRTIRLRSSEDTFHGELSDEDVRADYTVRNLVEAARVILHEAPASAAQPEAAAVAPEPTGAEPPADSLPSRPAAAGMTDSEVLRELLQHARQFVRMHHESTFSVSRLVGSIFQALAALSLGMVLWNFASMGLPSADLDKLYGTVAWSGVTVVLQLIALTFLLLSRHE